MVGETKGAPSVSATLSSHAAHALRYWEPRRLFYNGVLLVVVLMHFIASVPGSRQKLTMDLVLELFVLAVLANVAYCIAYAADLFVRFAGLEAPWRWGRRILLGVGTAFAATIAHFFATGLFRD
jgi:hypothetical protein